MEMLYEEMEFMWTHTLVHAQKKFMKPVWKDLRHKAPGNA